MIFKEANRSRFVLRKNNPCAPGIQITRVGQYNIICRKNDALQNGEHEFADKIVLCKSSESILSAECASAKRGRALGLKIANTIRVVLAIRNKNALPQNGEEHLARKLLTPFEWC